jgi:hypothetical protein
METKKFVQPGIFSMAVSLPLLALFIVLIFTTGLGNSSLIFLFSTLSLIMLFLFLFTYRMVIEIDQTHISFKMGIGLFHRKYRIDSLNDCFPVTNSLIGGTGIRRFSKGWLYNVSGNKAVELTFKDSEKLIRLGTNKPEEIAKLVMGILGKEHEAIDYTLSKRRNTRARNQYLLFGAVVVIIVLFNLYGLRSPKITLDKDYFIIGGLYGGSINYREIDHIDTLTAMPDIQMKTDGFAFSKVCKGNFWLKEEGNARLFINRSGSPFIKMRLNSGKVYYINFKERQKTIELFENLREKVK